MSDTNLSQLEIIKVTSIKAKHLKQIPVLSPYVMGNVELATRKAMIQRALSDRTLKPLAKIEGKHLPENIPGLYWLVYLPDIKHLYFVPAAHQGSLMYNEYINLPQLFVE